MSAAAATARAAAAAATVPYASSASLRFRKGVTTKKPLLTAAKSTTTTAAPRARRQSSAVSVRASSGGAVAEDPLSEEERAELSLLDHADAIKAARPGYVGAIDVDEDGEPLTPEAIRVMQQKEEFWVGQERNYQKWYAPKQYGNVMSEFVGEVDVDASPQLCYALWNDPSALLKFVPGLEKARRTPDGRCAECILFYQFADARTHPLEELRFMATVAESEDGAMIHWQSTDGFPCGAVVAFEPGTSSGTTRLKLEFYCHLPFELAQREGVMTVSLDVEERIAECLSRFAGFAAMVKAAGGVEALSENVSGDNDEEIIEAGVLPTGTGLVGADGRKIGRGGDTKVSRVAMERAAEEFEARVGRKPFAVELLKQLAKN